MSGTLSKRIASIQGILTGKTLSKYYCICWHILLQRNSTFFCRMPPNFIHVSDTLSIEYCIHSRTFFETTTFLQYYCFYWSILFQSNITFSKKKTLFPKSVSFSVCQLLVYREIVWQKQRFTRIASLNGYTVVQKSFFIQPLCIQYLRFKIKKILESNEQNSRFQAQKKHQRPAMVTIQ